MTKIIPMIIASLMLWSSSVTAQEALAVGACAASVRALCSGIQPGNNRIRACVREHIRDLSDPCLLSLAKLAEVDQACREHLNQACASVETGGGRLEACLKSAVATLSEACKDALVGAVPGAR